MTQVENDDNIEPKPIIAAISQSPAILSNQPVMAVPPNQAVIPYQQTAIPIKVVQQHDVDQDVYIDMASKIVNFQVDDKIKQNQFDFANNQQFQQQFQTLQKMAVTTPQNIVQTTIKENIAKQEQRVALMQSMQQIQSGTNQQLQVNGTLAIGPQKQIQTIDLPENVTEADITLPAKQAGEIGVEQYANVISDDMVKVLDIFLTKLHNGSNYNDLINDTTLVQGTDVTYNDYKAFFSTDLVQQDIQNKVMDQRTKIVYPSVLILQYVPSNFSELSTEAQTLYINVLRQVISAAIQGLNMSYKTAVAGQSQYTMIFRIQNVQLLKMLQRAVNEINTKPQSQLLQQVSNNAYFANSGTTSVPLPKIIVPM